MAGGALVFPASPSAVLSARAQTRVRRIRTGQVAGLARTARPGQGRACFYCMAEHSQNAGFCTKIPYLERPGSRALAHQSAQTCSLPRRAMPGDDGGNMRVRRRRRAGELPPLDGVLGPFFALFQLRQLANQQVRRPRRRTMARWNGPGPLFPTSTPAPLGATFPSQTNAKRQPSSSALLAP